MDVLELLWCELVLAPLVGFDVVVETFAFFKEPYYSLGPRFF